jgi:CRP-like cAMP-binding protein
MRTHLETKMTDLEKLLSSNDVFSWLSGSQLQRVVRAANPRSYQKGEVIIHAGDDWPYLFMVAEGGVSARKESREGRVFIPITLKLGEIFWGFSFFDDGAQMPVSLVADSPTRLHIWVRDQLLPVLIENGVSIWELARQLVRRMQQASLVLEELAFQPVTGRLARLLMERYQDAQSEHIARDMTLDEMAARIGSTREMVCRVLYQLADQGAIQINRTEFTIENSEVLAEIAESERG